MPVSEGVGDRRAGLKAGEICRLPKATKGQVLVYGDDGWEVGAAGIAEGDYTSWGNPILKDITLHEEFEARCSFFIDDKNDVIYVSWYHDTNDVRFGVYSASDFSVIFEFTSGGYYVYDYPRIEEFSGFMIGNAFFDLGGLSRSLQTYVLFLYDDEKTIKVWRGGSSALWSHDVDGDTPADYDCVISGAISLTGKYILVLVKDWTNVPYTYKLVLYKGLQD